MFIISVIPIAKGIGKEILTYFSATKLPEGSVVSVPLRDKTVRAIVESYKDAKSQKANLRSSSFALKKISSADALQFLLPGFVSAIREAARYFVGTTGASLELFIPSIVAEKSPAFVSMPATKPAAEKTARVETSHFEISALQTEDVERLVLYKSLIRESFANNRSLFIIFPTQETLEEAAKTLTKGIEDYAFVLHGGLGKMKILKDWTRAVGEKHAIVLLGTPQFLSLPRTDLSYIIVESEHSPHYIFQSRPYIDARFVAERLAKHLNCRLILGDRLLRTETWQRLSEGEIVEITPLKYRAISDAKTLLVDMTEEPQEDELSPILGAVARGLLQKSFDEEKSLFIFAARKGLSAITVCGDCGHIVTSSADVPMVLYTHPKGNIFVCPQTGETKSAKITCEHCGSWKLVPLGIGIERVEATVRKLFPKRTIVRFDSETATTKKKARELIDLFYSKPRGILIGTEKALPYLRDNIEYVAVASIDALFAVPDYRMSEKIMHILLALRAKTTERFLIQTRQPTQTVFDFALQGNLIGFLREESDLRQKLDWPPKTTLIKISRSGAPAVVQKDIALLEEIVKDWRPVIYPSLNAKRKGGSTMNVLIKMPANRWIDENLLAKLYALNAYFTVEVNPRTIL